MLPMGPPYHTVSGNTITIYLDVVMDGDSTLGPPIIDTIIPILSVEWNAIAAANGLTIIIALGPNTAAPIVTPVNQPVLTPNAINVVAGVSPPGGVNFFNFTVGRGTNALASTRSARVSYVTYPQGQGYIYQLPGQVPMLGQDISHELGHVLGLSDRYYEAVFWLVDYAVNMTPRQIRQGQWLAGNNDLRIGVQDTNNTTAGLPRLAVRAPLPIQVAGEPSFINLMSTGAATLSPTQIARILSQTPEQQYRAENWVAILGSWRFFTPPPNQPNWVPPHAPDAPGWLPTRPTDIVTNGVPLYPNLTSLDLTMWRYPSREATSQDNGTGIVFVPPGLSLHRYACVRRFKRGRGASGAIIHETRIAEAMGRRWVVGLHGIQKNPTTYHPNWMVYTRRMIRDLM